MLVIAVIIWWLVGAAGFVFWFTKDNNLMLGDVLLLFMVGFGGPLTWPVGWAIHGDHTNRKPRVLIRKRGN